MRAGAWYILPTTISSTPAAVLGTDLVHGCVEWMTQQREKWIKRLQGCSSLESSGAHLTPGSSIQKVHCRLEVVLFPTTSAFSYQNKQSRKQTPVSCLYLRPPGKTDDLEKSENTQKRCSGSSQVKTHLPADGSALCKGLVLGTLWYWGLQSWLASQSFQIIFLSPDLVLPKPWQRLEVARLENKHQWATFSK